MEIGRCGTVGFYTDFMIISIKPLKLRPIDDLSLSPYIVSLFVTLLQQITLKSTASVGRKAVIYSLIDVFNAKIPTRRFDTLIKI